MQVVQCKSGDTRPTSVINGWKVDTSDRPFKKFESAADYIAEVKKFARRFPRQRERAFVDNDMLHFGVSWYWLWHEEFAAEHDFETSFRMHIASCAKLRRRAGFPISTDEAHRFVLFGHAGERELV